jgi:hypothetical protein
MRYDCSRQLTCWPLAALVPSIAGFDEALHAAEYTGNRYATTTAQDPFGAKIARTNVERKTVELWCIEREYSAPAIEAASFAPFFEA